MKYPSREYSELVERLLKEREIKGNLSSAKLSPQECAVEIAQITDGALSSFEKESITLTISSGQKIVTTLDQDGEVIGSHLVGSFGIPPEAIQPKKRRGRPPGSRNRPKGS